MKKITFIILCLFVLSCNNKKSVQTQEIVDVEEVNKRVFFKWPKNGTTVASPVFIDMGVEGMLIEPAGVVKEGYGHHHILINQKFWPIGEVIPASDSTLHYGKGQTDTSIELAPGKYLISLQFADGVHVSFGEEMSETIEINVE